MSRSTLNEIANGLFTYWKLNRPKIIERVLPSNHILDVQFLVRYRDNYLEISLFKNTVLLEKFIDDDGETIVNIYEEFNLADDGKHTFCKKFTDVARKSLQTSSPES